MDMGPGQNGIAGAPPAGSRFTEKEVGALLDWKQQAPLATSGAPSDKIYTQPDHDYPDDTDICFARGNGVTLVRLTPADRPKLLEAVGGLVPELSPLLAQADALARQGVPEEHGQGNANTAAAFTALVTAAHAAGYRLACDDHRATAEDAGLVSGFLLEKLAWERQRAGDSPDTEALERVIALLGGHL